MMCRLTPSFDSLMVGTRQGRRLTLSFKCSMPGTLRGCRAFSARRAHVTKFVASVRLRGWRWFLRVGDISSPTSPRSNGSDTVKLVHMGGCGVGVCGGVPSGVPHAPWTFFLARDKYIAPLNLQKASSREVNR